MHVATTVCEQLGVQNVRMVLSARPPHRDSVPVNHRWQMLQLACATDPRLIADDREMLRNKASYTVDTLRAERRRAPARPLFWVIGMDSLLTFTTWYRWWRILDLAHLVVVRRPGYPERLGPLLRSIVAARLWAVPAAAAERDARASAAWRCRENSYAGGAYAQAVLQ